MANEFTLKAIIKAVDQVSTPMRCIAASFNPLQEQIASIQRASEGVGSSLKKMIAPLSIIGASGLAGLSASLRNVADYGDEVGSLVERIGWLTKTLQEYMHIAKYSDMSTEEFTSSLETMTKQMDQLRVGTGPLISGLQKIAPVVLDQIKAAETNEEAFDLMIKAIQRVEDPIRKAHLAQVFFGQSGKKMVHLANQGADGIKNLREEAHRMGLVLDEDAIKNSKLFKENMDKLKDSVSGITRTISVAFLPAVIEVMKNVKEWIALNKDLIVTNVSSFLKSVTSAVTTLYQAGSTLFDVLGGIDNIFYIWASVRIASLAKSLFVLGETIMGLRPAFIASLAGIKTAFIASLAGIKTAFVGVSVAIGPLIAGVALVAAGVYVLYKHFDKVKAFLNGFWDGFISSFRPVLDSFKELFSALGAVFSALKPIGDFVSWIVRSVVDLIRGVVDLIGKILEVKDALSTMGKIGEIVGKTLGITYSMILTPLECVVKAISMILKAGAWVIEKVAGWFSGSDSNKAEMQAHNDNNIGSTGFVSPMISSGSQINKSKAEVVVKFNNMPRGATVNSDISGQGMDLGVESGYAMPAAVR